MQNKIGASRCTVPSMDRVIGLIVPHYVLWGVLYKHHFKPRPSRSFLVPVSTSVVPVKALTWPPLASFTLTYPFSPVSMDGWKEEEG